jgi:hypothetical protein
MGVHGTCTHMYRSFLSPHIDTFTCMYIGSGVGLYPVLLVEDGYETGSSGNMSSGIQNCHLSNSGNRVILSDSNIKFLNSSTMSP